MMNRPSAVLIPMFALLLTAAPLASAGKDVLFEDDLRGELEPGWSWLREDPDGWRITDKGLEIRKEPGTLPHAKNLLVRRAPTLSKGQGQLAAEVTVHHIRKNQYEQAGLVWYYDDGHYVKLVMELVNGKPMIVMGNRGGRGGGKGPLEADTARLRYIVDGNRITGYVRPKGAKKWRSVGSGTLPEAGDKPAKLSLQTYHGPKDGSRWSRFTDFRLLRRPEPK